MKNIAFTLSILLFIACSKTKEDTTHHEINYKNEIATGEILGKSFELIDSKINRIVKGVNIVNSSQ